MEIIENQDQSGGNNILSQFQKALIIHEDKTKEIHV